MSNELSANIKNIISYASLYLCLHTCFFVVVVVFYLATQIVCFSAVFYKCNSLEHQACRGYLTSPGPDVPHVYK